ncbi:MAG TPA: iron ABC transporter permease, partial [Candidatus Limnocylindrales bacterium]|nr:iron ABC transporter permease [Candidatus Limnocylindrales bacterium]
MRTLAVLAALGAALAASMAAGVLVGAVPIAPGDIVAALLGSGGSTESVIVRDLRLPRVLAAALVGGALAASGALLQGLLRNPLADPFVTGTSAGAALGAVAVIALGGTGTAGLVPLAAFAGALAAVVLVWRLAQLGGRTTVLTVLRAGIVLTSFAGAVITVLLVASDRLALRLRAVLDGLVGGVTTRGGGELAVAAAIVVVGLVVALALAPRVDAYAFGEETAATLGVDTQWTTGAVLAATAMLTGAAVALAGLVGFVGLVVPHALRMVVGATRRRLVAASFLGGAAALVLADVGARTMLAPGELPVGAITGLVGAP